MGARAPQLPGWIWAESGCERRCWHGAELCHGAGLCRGCASRAWGCPGGLVPQHGLGPRSVWLPDASSEACCSCALPLVEVAKVPRGPSFGTSVKCEMFPARGGSWRTQKGRLETQSGAPRGCTDLWLSKPAPFPAAPGSCVPHSCTLMPSLAFCSRRTKSIL